jgi:putative transposase
MGAPPPLLPKHTGTPGRRGRPPRPLRQMVNGIMYVNKTGCQWRMLPKDFGPWETVYGYFRRWRREGVWERVMTQLQPVRAPAPWPARRAFRGCDR